MTFGERLRNARLSKGLTQEQLAHQIGVAKSTLTGYEKGNREPDVFKIKKILDVLEIDSNYLFDIEQSVDITTPQSENKKNTPTTESSDVEAEVAQTVEALTDFFVAAGYMAPGGDISDETLGLCKLIVDMADLFFRKQRLNDHQ